LDEDILSHSCINLTDVSIQSLNLIQDKLSDHNSFDITEVSIVFHKSNTSLINVVHHIANSYQYFLFLLSILIKLPISFIPFQLFIAKLKFLPTTSPNPY
jgi:hypothetical protein